MAKGKKNSTQEEEPKIVSFETFRKLDSFDINTMTHKEPSSVNGRIRIEKFKVTIEKLEEPKEVYVQRLQKLWDECDNYHHVNPIREKAESLGIELVGSYGSKRK